MNINLKKITFLCLVLVLIGLISFNSISANDLGTVLEDNDNNGWTDLNNDDFINSDVNSDSINKEAISNLKSLNSQDESTSSDSNNFASSNSNSSVASSSNSSASSNSANFNSSTSSNSANSNANTNNSSSDASKTQTIKLSSQEESALNEFLNAIKTTTKGTIVLKNDLVLNQTISLNNNITIDGRNHSISSLDVTNMFKTFAKITLKNIVFTNYHEIENLRAILNSGELTVLNCQFNGFSYLTNGSAIYNSKKLTVQGTKFNNNYVNNSGGAIYSTGTLTINNSSFNKNHAGKNGGAIYSTLNLILNQSVFSNNSANESGGALYSKGSGLNIKYSRFNNNSASLNGGALYSSSNSTVISYSNFVSNFVEAYDKASNGGAAFIYCGSKIAYSNFTSNHCKTTLTNSSQKKSIQSMGGALFYYGGNHTLSFSNFNKNSVENDGGAVRIAKNVGKFTLNKCNFTNNNASYEDGGAISLATPNITISNSIFKNNFANEDGGAIDTFSLGSYKVNVLIKNCLFNSNTAFKAAGAIYLGVNTVQSIVNSNFTSNKATVAGAFYIESISVSISNCIFSSNKADNVSKKTIYNKQGKVVSHSGGAVFVKNGSTVTIKNSLFKSNKATSGGAITNHGKMVIDKCNFTSNSATNGGALYGGGKTSTIRNSIFYKNSATKTGGALFINEGNVNMKSSMIVSNTAKSYSVYSTVSITLNNNWWGNTLSIKDKSPKTLGLTNVKVSTWLHLKIRAKTTKLAKGKTTTLTIDLRYNNNDKLVSTAFNNPLTLTVSEGTLSSKKVNLKNGKATVKFKKTNSKTAVVKVKLLGKTARCTIKAK